ncbi:MAG: hypothetical protein BWY52_03122 [Chloroflexi bacterium ADurb.Bin325]|nr:MAG: hypothetical protein BWY52_03122 [Chloroflexi bacterium ADurb.Bin325]
MPSSAITLSLFTHSRSDPPAKGAPFTPLVVSIAVFCSSVIPPPPALPLCEPKTMNTARRSSVFSSPFVPAQNSQREFTFVSCGPQVPKSRYLLPPSPASATTAGWRAASPFVAIMYW